MTTTHEDDSDRPFGLTELVEIGISLLTERDHRTLLEMILAQARRITRADAGSLYLVEQDESGVRQLRFMLAQNESVPHLAFVEQTMPLDTTSVAGEAALSARPLVIDDAYAMPAGAPFKFNRHFDATHGYRTKSLLVVPMANHRGEVIGVLQLINRKRDPRTPFSGPADVERRVEPFDERDLMLVRALAGQAAVSIENSQLYAAIEQLFEGFVRAAVTAIEQRDPTTSGHSERVASMTVKLAEAVHLTPNGRFGSVVFTVAQLRELRYAALLHDFGKVGVREHVLVKGKKLYPSDLELIHARHAFLTRTAAWRFERARADYLERNGRDGYDAFRAQLVASHEEEIAGLDRFLATVESCNEPTVELEPDGPKFKLLATYADTRYETLGGEARPLLSPDEVAALSIRRGTLDASERREIESHVSHTYGFLRRIPWTAELRHVPDIAHAHHEKLNGTGYPRAVTAAEIPIQARMMTISDIYDALTASDRPYKKAVPMERALDILSEEVGAGSIDRELSQLFVAARAHEAARPAAS